MNPMRKWRWPLIAAMFAMVAHLFMMMAPVAVQAAPGSLLHALSIICTPDGTSHFDNGQDAAAEGGSCDHCTLCFGLGAPLPTAIKGEALSHRGSSASFTPRPADLVLLNTIGERPAGRAPPASLTELP